MSKHWNIIGPFMHCPMVFVWQIFAPLRQSLKWLWDSLPKRAILLTLAATLGDVITCHRSMTQSPRGFDVIYRFQSKTEQWWPTFPGKRRERTFKEIYCRYTYRYLIHSGTYRYLIHSFCAV